MIDIQTLNRYINILVEDKISQNFILHKADSINCVHGENTDNPTELTTQDLNATLKILQSLITLPIGEAYSGINFYHQFFALCSEKSIKSIERSTQFFIPSMYQSKAKVFDLEMGRFFNLHFIKCELPVRTLKSLNEKPVTQIIIFAINPRDLTEKPAFLKLNHT